VLHDLSHSVLLRVTQVAPLDPRLHLGMLVGRLVVDQMKRETLRALAAEVLQKTEPLFVGAVW
jgi:hypothetical protein